jgi:ATP-dependent exoDNAse (exonuclease V) beta subunit
MTVAEVALVAAVSTDSAGIVFGDVRAAASSPDVRPALGTGSLLEISWTRTLILDVESVEAAITSLAADAEYDNTTIEALQSSKEHEAILEKIDRIVGNSDYQVEGDDDELRPPEYGDIAVLTRTRDFGRELLDTADEYDFPLAYEGGIEVFRTDAAKLLLAWLRILERDADRGWAIVLEEAGYTLDEVDHILEDGAYPADMTDFRTELEQMETFGGVARRVFDRYGCDGPTADVVLHTVQSVFEASTLTRGDLIRFIEDAIESGSTHEVHAGAGTNAVTVQTIHATKGLEYPIVILANMNKRKFPSTGGGSSDLIYDDPIGIRQRTLYSEKAHGVPHVYDNWHADVLRWTLPRNYHEERRLLYVAITRAENHVVFTAGEDANTFLENLPVDVVETEPSLTEVTPEADPDPPFTVDIPECDGLSRLSPHTFIDEGVFDGEHSGRGMDFGSAVPEFAEDYVLGEDVTPDSNDERNIKRFLDDLEGELLAEEDAFLPLAVDGEDVTISGVIDLLCVSDDAVSIIDYKTDLDRHAESEYRKQLSVYCYVVAALYPERSVSISIYYTADDDRKQLQPLSNAALRDEVRAASNTQG